MASNLEFIPLKEKQETKHANIKSENNKPSGTLVDGSVSAGFPSPAEDYAEMAISIDDLIKIQRPSIFVVRVKGDSMVDYGIMEKSLLVVDKAKEYVHGSIVVAFLHGEFLVKKLHLKNGEIKLIAGNKNYKDTIVTKDDFFEIWGVVSHCLNQY